MSIAWLQDPIVGASINPHFGTIKANNVMLGELSLRDSVSSIQAQVVMLSTLAGASHSVLTASNELVNSLSTLTQKVNALDSYARAIGEALIIEGATYPPE